MLYVDAFICLLKVVMSLSKCSLSECSFGDLEPFKPTMLSPFFSSLYILGSYVGIYLNIRIHC